MSERSSGDHGLGCRIGDRYPISGNSCIDGSQSEVSNHRVYLSTERPGRITVPIADMQYVTNHGTYRTV